MVKAIVYVSVCVCVCLCVCVCVCLYVFMCMCVLMGRGSILLFYAFVCLFYDGYFCSLMFFFFKSIPCQFLGIVG